MSATKQEDMDSLAKWMETAFNLQRQLDDTASKLNWTENMLRSANASAESNRITLRDLFAGQALASMRLVAPPDTVLAYEDAAQEAYAIAEAMLAERAKGGAK